MQSNCKSSETVSSDMTENNIVDMINYTAGKWIIILIRLITLKLKWSFHIN